MRVWQHQNLFPLEDGWALRDLIRRRRWTPNPFFRGTKKFFSPKLFFSWYETSQAGWIHLKVGKEVLKSRLGKNSFSFCHEILAVKEFLWHVEKSDADDVKMWRKRSIVTTSSMLKSRFDAHFIFYYIDSNLDLVVQGTYETFWCIFCCFTPTPCTYTSLLLDGMAWNYFLIYMDMQDH